MYKTIINIIFLVASTVLTVVLAVDPQWGSDLQHRIFGSITQHTPSSQVSPTTTTATTPSLLSYLGGIEAFKNTSSTLPQHVAITTSGIVDATNQERINAGLPPLKLNNLLVESATRKTMDMIAKQYFEHTSPSGITVSDLGRQVGYDYIVMGENLALGDFANSQDVVNAWMQSPGHRANILNPGYQEIGAFAAKGTYQGKDVWFVVQHFGTPRAVCPQISTSLKNSIDTINASLKQLQVQILNEKATLESANHPEGSAYESMVNDFNGLVAQYNTSLVISQDKTKEYNAQVTAFNNCLVHYQSTSAI